MDIDIIQSQWQQLARRMKGQWGKLTDADLDVEDGHRDYLIRKLQERYGLSRGSAEHQVREFVARL